MLDLTDIAQSLVAHGKGILAADESGDTADNKRLKPHGIEPSEENRRKFRDLLLATPGVEQYLTGVILYDETLHQSDDAGTPFAKSLSNKGIIPGIKVDEGLEPFPESPDETITKGLLGLPERLAEYKKTYDTGFTKWRAAIKIDGTRLPTAQAIHENAKRLAMYALEVQKAGMVPMVEPEMLLDGNHSRMRAKEVLTDVIGMLMQVMEEQAVDMSAIILKTSMVLSGKDSGHTDTPEEVAADTMSVLMDTVPIEVPGIVFLSGGQSPDQATTNLAAIAKLAKEMNAPWPLTFSYARALQEDALATWAGKDENIPAAREVFLERLKKVSAALT
ncbi:MAG: Fructose-bisphosphate aldolase, class [Parcubacteria group bacterium]|nr:Fructose-bisphosphate aldolase, class [Parcubacteria group bacterium]